MEYISENPLSLNRNYFETSHGKSPCDGLGSIAVARKGVVLACGKDVFDCCQKTLAHGPQARSKVNGNPEISKWDFFYIPVEEMDHAPGKTFPIKGIRKLHSVMNSSDNRVKLYSRLSCFCVACSTDDYKKCENKNWVQEWTKHAITDDQSTYLDEAGASYNADEEENSKAPEIGEFVAVKLGSRKKGGVAHVYMGEVLNVEEEGVVVKYMKKQGTLYQWPEEEDISFQPLNDIICLLKHPSLTNERSQFRFDDDQIQKVLSFFPKSTIYLK